MDVRYMLPEVVVSAVDALGIDGSQIDGMSMEREGDLVVYRLTVRGHRVRELVMEADELATIHGYPVSASGGGLWPCAQIPPPDGSDTLQTYVMRLLDMWADDAGEAVAAWSVMASWEVDPDNHQRIADDCRRALAIVRGDTPPS